MKNKKEKERKSKKKKQGDGIDGGECPGAAASEDAAAPGFCGEEVCKAQQRKKDKLRLRIWPSGNIISLMKGGIHVPIFYVIGIESRGGIH